MNSVLQFFPRRAFGHVSKDVHAVRVSMSTDEMMLTSQVKRKNPIHLSNRVGDTLSSADGNGSCIIPLMPLEQRTEEGMAVKSLGKESNYRRIQRKQAAEMRSL
jgi:hypothetical protein